MLLSVQPGLGQRTDTSVPRAGLRIVVPTVVSVTTRVTSVLGLVQRQRVNLGVDICPPHQAIQS